MRTWSVINQVEFVFFVFISSKNKNKNNKPTKYPLFFLLNPLIIILIHSKSKFSQQIKTKEIKWREQENEKKGLKQ